MVRPRQSKQLTGNGSVRQNDRGCSLPVLLLRQPRDLYQVIEEASTSVASRKSQAEVAHYQTSLITHQFVIVYNQIKIINQATISNEINFILQCQTQSKSKSKKNIHIMLFASNQKKFRSSNCTWSQMQVQTVQVPY